MSSAQYQCHCKLCGYAGISGLWTGFVIHLEKGDGNLALSSISDRLTLAFSWMLCYLAFDVFVYEIMAVFV